MKQSIWIGITMSLITIIAQAAEESPNQNPTTCAMLPSRQGNENSALLCSDGSVVLTKLDGSKQVVPKETVDIIKNLNLGKKAIFNGNSPCISAAKAQ